MTPSPKRRLTIFLILGLAIACVGVSCRHPEKPQPEAEATAVAGEPETYSATLVRSIEDGTRHEVTETLVMRSGDLRREEWLEHGERRALIMRYDTGKCFLLNLDKQLYVESELSARMAENRKENSPIDNANRAPSAGENEKPVSDTNRQTSAVDFVEDNFSEEPTKIESRALADETIARELCKVVERRLSFADGRTETIRSYQAERLYGLTIKTEMESLSPTNRVKVITEWRDLRLEVSAEVFVVPAHFKKVSGW